MNVLVFDTETTGLPKRRELISSPTYPKLVQFAGILYDEKRRPIITQSFVVNPLIPIPEIPQKVHGISDQCAEEFGFTRKTASGIINFMFSRASVAVAHNLEYDRGIIDHLFYTETKEPYKWPKKLICTAESTTKILNLPPTDKMKQYGFTGPKKPNLSELYAYLFDGGTFEGAHDALNDTRACADCFWKMIDTGQIEM